MTDALQSYRDDGPLAEVLARATAGRHLPWALFTFLGVASLVAGLALDGGDIGVWAVVGVAGFLLFNATVRPEKRPLGWFTPPLLRVGEYAFFIVVAASSGAQTRPAVYALLAAVAFHHYDLVYRLRHQNLTAPAWVRRAGLGWDGRMLLAIVLAATSSVAIGSLVFATWCAVIFVAESIRSWTSLQRPTGRAVVISTDEDDEV